MQRGGEVVDVPEAMDARPVVRVDLNLRPGPDLWLTGTLPAGPRLAVVGSRAAHRTLRTAVPTIVRVAHDMGWSIVSGGALGIDGDAHRAALADGVPQLAVLPCAPERPYPADHRSLFEEIGAHAGSGLLFAHGPGVQPARGMFASRNRLVVGLATAVVVVQAGIRSGTMGTGRLSLTRKRPLAAVAGSPGAAKLVSMGAVGLRWDTSDPTMLEGQMKHFLATFEARPGEQRWPPALRWLRDRFAELAARGGTVSDLGPDPVRAACALAEAEALGLVTEIAAGRYVRT